MSTPTPVIYGTVGYAAGCIFLLVVTKISQITGALSKDNTGIGFTVIIMSCICMWLIWVMAWFHQWHPLISPEFPSLE